MEFIPIYFDKKNIKLVKDRNEFAKLYYKLTGKHLRPLFGNGFLEDEE